MFDHGYAKPNTPVISVYRQHTPEVVPERHIKERRGAQAGSCDGALNITPPGHYTPPGAAPSLRPAICSTSSPWHKSSTGCETRRMRHRDTETQRISRFSPCLCASVADGSVPRRPCQLSPRPPRRRSVSTAGEKMRGHRGRSSCLNGWSSTLGLTLALGLCLGVSPLGSAPQRISRPSKIDRAVQKLLTNGS